MGDDNVRPTGDKLANVRTFLKEIENPEKDGSTSNSPLLVAMETTTRCNFNCVHCSRALSGKPPADMDLELFQAIVPASRFALEVYLFGDGEVLLNVPQHLAMISRIYRQNPGCRLGFSTNGRLLTPDVYRLYATAGIQYVQLSIDAATKKLYETMRRGGSYDELINNLEGIADWRRRFNLHHPVLILATVISQQNFRELPELARFAEKYGFSHWYINAESPQNPGRDRLRLTEEDRSELQRIRAGILDTYSSSFSVQFDSSIGLPAVTAEKWLEQESRVFCAAPWQQFQVKANGDVRVCPYFHQPICSVEGRSFADVWNGQEFRQVRKAFSTLTHIPSGCANCNLGIRKQFLPDSPAMAGFRRGGFSGWLRRGVVQLEKLLSHRR